MLSAGVSEWVQRHSLLLMAVFAISKGQRGRKSEQSRGVSRPCSFRSEGLATLKVNSPSLSV